MILYLALALQFWRKIPLALLMFVLFTGFSLPSIANEDNEQSEDHREDLKIKEKGDLKFGKVASSINQPGKVIIDAASGAKTVTGGVFDFGGTHRRAKFKIKGEKNARIYVTLPTSITIKDNGGGYLATVDTFTMNKNNPVKLNNKGKVTLYVGATLRVGVNQKDKKYKGEFDVTIEYQ